MHFLVVDDDDDCRSTVVEYLSAMGFNYVSIARNGVDAFRIVSHNPTINFIISDWEMPKVSGIDLLRSCKLSNNLKKIPFLMITSQTSFERMKIIQAGKANVDQYLLKPFNLSVFQERVLSIIENSKCFLDHQEAKLVSKMRQMQKKRGVK